MMTEDRSHVRNVGPLIVTLKCPCDKDSDFESVYANT